MIMMWNWNCSFPSLTPVWIFSSFSFVSRAGRKQNEILLNKVNPEYSFIQTLQVFPPRNKMGMGTSTFVTRWINFLTMVMLLFLSFCSLFSFNFWVCQFKSFFFLYFNFWVCLFHFPLPFTFIYCLVFMCFFCIPHFGFHLNMFQSYDF